MARSSFKFRLQRLLEIRVMKEKAAQQELQALRAKVVVEQQRLEGLKAEEAVLHDRMNLRPGQTLDIADRQNCAYAIELKRKEQSQQQNKIKNAEKAVVAQQEVVKQAGIDVKALEKLREKQLAEHTEEQLREQAVFLDDIAGQQYSRRRVIAEQHQAEADERAAIAGDAP